ncbi:hypothetical protein GN156_08170 [bacterium LRH843]|nr:hypothetical protein [bacterium LRH843]
MFRGNKPVLILPAILMIIMFIGGYQFLQTTGTTTNEDLKEVMELDLATTKVKDELQIEVNWDWTVMPAEGFYGTDYVGIAFIDKETGEILHDAQFEESKLELLYADRVIEESVGTVVQNGIIFEFSNKLVEQESYGNLGRAIVTVRGKDVKPEDVQVHYLHTLVEHSPLVKEDATFQTPNFSNATNVPYWILTR